MADSNPVIATSDSDKNKRVVYTAPNPVIGDFKIFGNRIRPSVSESVFNELTMSEAKQELLSGNGLIKVVELYLPWEDMLRIGYVDKIENIRVGTMNPQTTIHMSRHGNKLFRTKVDPYTLGDYKSLWDVPVALMDVTLVHPFYKPGGSHFKVGNKMRYYILQIEESDVIRKPS